MNLIVNNSKFLQKFKSLKNKLINGEIEAIHVPQKNNITIKILAEKKKTPFEIFLELIEKHPLKKIQRPKEDIF